MEMKKLSFEEGNILKDESNRQNERKKTALITFLLLWQK